MIGAGIFRSGFVINGSAIEWSRVARIGLGVGLPLSLAATWLTQRELVGVVDWRWPDSLHTLSALPLAAGLAGLVFLWRARPGQRWLWSRVEAAGRTALTNYIGQSFVIALLAEPWGFGLYGGPERCRDDGNGDRRVRVARRGELPVAQILPPGPLEWL